MINSMINVLYQDIESVLKIKGGLSASFKALYVKDVHFTISPLNHCYRDFAKKLVLFCIHHRISAHADDVIVRGQADFASLVSSVKVNWVKSKALGEGQWGYLCYQPMWLGKEGG